MGRITTNVGLITGFPIQDTVDQLIELQARPRDQLKTQTQKIERQQTALTDLSTVLLSLQFATNKLSTASVYGQRQVTSSSTALGATSTGAAALGSYQFTPVQRAQAHQLLSSRFASTTAPVGAGKFSFRFGGFVDAGASLDLLNGGAGFDRGKIRITDRSGASAEIDLSHARTIDDVLEAINAASGIQVTATAHGDQLRLTDETGLSAANLRVQEVDGGTAASLGLAGVNVAAGQADGQDILSLFDDLDLDQLNAGAGVRFDDALADLKITLRSGEELVADFQRLAVTGTKASVTTTAASGLDAQITFTAVQAGSAWDGVAISFVDDPGVTAGQETVVYDPQAKTLTFQIDAGATTADHVAAALAEDATASAAFTATRPAGSNGSGIISVADSGVTDGPGGVIVEPATTTDETTLGDVLAALNALDPAKLQASLSASGDRIELTDLTVGAGAFEVSTLNGSHAAEDLGLTTAAAGGTLTGERLLGGLKTSLLRNLAGGAGLDDLGLLSLTDRSGASALVDLSAAETLNDVLDAVNAAGLGITAEVNAARNGLSLRDTSGGSGPLVIANGDGVTTTADRLGIAVNAAVASRSSGSLKLKTLSENTTLASLNGGAGVALGAFTISDTLGVSATVNVTADVKNVGDLLDRINSRGLAIAARVNDAGDGIVLVDTAEGASQLKVTEGARSTAADLHLLGSATQVDVGGTPTWTLEGSTTITIDLDADDTLQDLVSRINATGNKVTAAILNDGAAVKPLRLTLTSQRSGQAGELLVDTSQASFTLEETVQAQDALLLYGASSQAVLAASTTNTFSGLVEGLSLEVKEATGNPVTVTVGSATTDLIATVQASVEILNRLTRSIRDLTAYNADTDERAVLHADGAVLRVETDVARLVSGRIAGAGPIQSLAEIGITLNGDGDLEFDAEELRARFTADPASVREFLSKETTGLAARFKALTNQLAGDEDSLLGARSLALQDKLTTYNLKIEFYNDRLDSERERLLLSFQRMELAISKIRNSQSALDSLAALATLT